MQNWQERPQSGEDSGGVCGVGGVLGSDSWLPSSLSDDNVEAGKGSSGLGLLFDRLVPRGWTDCDCRCGEIESKELHVAMPSAMTGPGVAGTEGGGDGRAQRDSQNPECIEPCAKEIRQSIMSWRVIAEIGLPTGKTRCMFLSGCGCSEDAVVCF